MTRTAFLAAVAGLFIAVAYIIGYYNSPGPYLQEEDEFEYVNHHCVPKEKSALEYTWGSYANR